MRTADKGADPPRGRVLSGIRRWLVRMLVVMAVITSSLASLLYWAAGGRQTPGEHQGKVVHYPPQPGSSAQSASPAETSTLVVMSWNIAYARGTNPDNDANEVAPKAVILRRLREMGDLVRRHGVDLLLLQEVDFDSKRSRHVDQLAELSRHSGLAYAAPAVSWRARWVPHPPWPPSKHYGPVKSGGAVLSRYPIEGNRVVLYPKPEENGWLYNAFYLFRYSQWVTLRRGKDRLMVINNHLEAFKKANRILQARMLAERLRNLKQDGPVLLGGDLNTTPPEAAKKSGFSDCVEDDYQDDQTLSLLRGVPGFSELVPAQTYGANESAYFTFPSSAPTRRLDYLFFDQHLSLRRVTFLPIRDYSDHRPILAHFTLKAKATP